MQCRIIFIIFCLLSTKGFANSRTQRQLYQEHSEDIKIVNKEHMWNKSAFLFGISLDFILWVAKEDTNLATVGTYTLEGTDDHPQTGLIYPKAYSRPGFKAGLEGFSTLYNWDFFIQYTWFSNDHNPSKPFYHYGNFNNTRLILPAWNLTPFWIDTVNTSLDNVTTVISAWSSLFNRLDVTLGRSFFIGKSFVLQEMFGLSGFLLSQTFSLDVTDVVIDSGGGGIFSSATTDIYKPYVRSKQNAGGFGPYVTEDIEYCFFEDRKYRFGIFSKLGMSLFWSKFRACWQVNGVVGKDTIPNFPMVNTKNRIWTVSPMLEILLGVRFQSVLQDGYLFCLQLGWELSSWFDQNYIFTTPWRRGPGTSDALYTMQGLTIQIKVSF